MRHPEAVGVLRPLHGGPHAGGPPGRWREAALTGSPDFLIHLHQKTVTWSDLWSFYAEGRCRPGATLALTGYFHAAMSRVCDGEGSVLDHDGGMYPLLREWAHFAVEHDEFVPEARLRDSLGGLLGLGIVSAFYYEAVFGIYLECLLERQCERGAEPCQDGAAAVRLPRGRLQIRWPQQETAPSSSSQAPRAQALSVLVEEHYAEWNRVYCLAVGEPTANGHDEGGEG